MQYLKSILYWGRRGLIAALLLLYACIPKETAQQKETDGAGYDRHSQKAIRLVYPEWSSEIVSAHLIQAVLQERLAYEVRLVPVEVEEMWQRVASGEADVLAGAWLPATHEDYYAEYGDQLVDLGPNLKGARIGLVVPTVIPGRQTAGSGKTGRELVTIRSIEELRTTADRFGGRIVGIEGAAGVMSRTKEALAAYGLKRMFRVVEKDEQRMVDRVATAIHQGDWIVFTGWRPHWIFELYNLRFLDDPKNVFGSTESIHTMVRKGIAEEMPEVVAVLSRISCEPEEIERIMRWIRTEEADPYSQALRWIELHRERVDSWVEGVE